MATAAVSAAAHSTPPIPIPSIPRIRPPRLLPGTRSPNTNPQPPGPVPHDKIWVQGKWRSPVSNASKHVQGKTRAQVKKAVKHQRNGWDIFAYYHLRTSQVVYSLTRMMQTGQIMPQLVFHSKKTVPAGLRPDVWRPYFSIHFPETSVGERAGLVAYQRLREFSMRRQLSPEMSTLMTTPEDIEKLKKKAGDPVDVREKIKDQRLKLPTLGYKLPKHLRAQKLMDQKATSVADVAFVLEMATQWMAANQDVDFSKDNTEEKLKQLGRRGRKRLRAIRKQEAAINKKIAARQILAQKSYLKDGQSKPEPTDLKESDVVQQNPLKPGPGEVQMFWADMRDGTYAESWPNNVFHSELVSYLSPTRDPREAKQGSYLDDADEDAAAQNGPGPKIIGRSPHVFGRQHLNGDDELREVRQQGIESDLTRKAGVTEAAAEEGKTRLAGENDQDFLRRTQGVEIEGKDVNWWQKVKGGVEGILRRK